MATDRLRKNDLCDPHGPGESPASGPPGKPPPRRDEEPRPRQDAELALGGNGQRSLRDLGPFLRAAARRGQGKAVETEDAVQEAWLIVLTRIGSHRGDESGSLLAWLAVVVRNHLSSLERHAAARPGVFLAMEDSVALVGREEDPAEAYERGRIREEVWESLEEARSHLTDASYRIVILRWLEGRTTPEIASALGLSAAQVRDRHRRALPVLRCLLERRFGPDSPMNIGHGRPATHPGRNPGEVTS